MIGSRFSILGQPPSINLGPEATKTRKKAKVIMSVLMAY
jgi:hypothetical protein